VAVVGPLVGVVVMNRCGVGRLGWWSPGAEREVGEILGVRSGNTGLRVQGRVPVTANDVSGLMSWTQFYFAFG
jgi:hypothetical protein